MIYSLVDVQKSVEKMNDIIRGKGNGLIILLHGSPGTGKTLTAERFVSKRFWSLLMLTDEALRQRC
jgi:ATP-dependent 26S proteasome regulatory subunit